MWTAMASLAADLFGKLIAPILGFLTSWRAERTARDLGRAEQGRADAEQGLREAQNANQARARVGDDVGELLKPPAERHR